MMKELKEIRDDQIRIIGEGESKNPCRVMYGLSSFLF